MGLLSFQGGYRETCFVIIETGCFFQFSFGTLVWVAMVEILIYLISSICLWGTNLTHLFDRSGWPSSFSTWTGLTWIVESILNSLDLSLQPIWTLIIWEWIGAELPCVLSWMQVSIAIRHVSHHAMIWNWQITNHEVQLS